MDWRSSGMFSSIKKKTDDRTQSVAIKGTGLILPVFACPSRWGEWVLSMSSLHYKINKFTQFSDKKEKAGARDK